MALIGTDVACQFQLPTGCICELHFSIFLLTLDVFSVVGCCFMFWQGLKQMPPFGLCLRSPGVFHFLPGFCQLPYSSHVAKQHSVQVPSNWLGLAWAAALLKHRPFWCFVNSCLSVSGGKKNSFQKPHWVSVSSVMIPTRLKGTLGMLCKISEAGRGLISLSWLREEASAGLGRWLSQ